MKIREHISKKEIRKDLESGISGLIGNTELSEGTSEIMIDNHQ